MKRTFLLITIILFFFLSSCKEEFDFTANDITLYVNEEVDIPFRGPKNIQFMSDNDNVLIIGHKMKAISPGTSLITPIGEKHQDKSFRVTIEAAFSFNVESVIIKKGEKAEYSFYLIDGYNLELKPLNDCLVFHNGFFVGTKIGESGIKAKVTRGDYIYEVILPVYVILETLVLEKIVITGSNSLDVDKTTKLTATLIPNTYETVTWSSSDERIATVNKGYVTAHQAGVVTIIASLGNISDSHEITIVENTSAEYVDLYYINDLHGAIEREGNSLGLAYIANFIDKRREENPNTLLLAGGDILQGQAISNYYYGSSTLTIMELMGFDAMIIGNHEFDWGLNKVTDQFHPNTGIVSFPLLGINVRKKSTNQIPENILPYVMIEKPEAKVGVIGVIGEYLESSIAYNMVKDYEFINPLSLIKNAASTLRNNGADYVIVVIHDDNDSLNYNLSLLSGEERIDAIFNAHSHALYRNTINDVPVIQAKANGEYVGHVRLYKNGTYTLSNIYSHDDLNEPSTIVNEQIEIYKAETDPIFNKLIIQNGTSNLNSIALSKWLVEVIKNKTGADIAFQNSGGTRTGLTAYENITLKKLYQIWPFDNVIKTVILKGSLVRNLMDGNIYTELEIEDDKEYLVAMNDYMFDHPYNQETISQGREQTNTGILLRDLAEEELIRQSEIHDYFNPSNPIITTYFFREEYLYLYL